MTLDTRYEVGDPSCGLVSTARTLLAARESAVGHLYWHADPVTVEVCDRMARHGNPELYHLYLGEAGYYLRPMRRRA